jgi:hypothetical protein
MPKFEKGNSGKPKGSKNKVNSEIGGVFLRIL